MRAVLAWTGLRAGVGDRRAGQGCDLMTGVDGAEWVTKIRIGGLAKDREHPAFSVRSRPLRWSKRNDSKTPTPIFPTTGRINGDEAHAERHTSSASRTTQARNPKGPKGSWKIHNSDPLAPKRRIRDRDIQALVAEGPC
jgi:hypothetical protein